MNPAEQILEELRHPARELSERIPGVLGGCGSISTAALTDCAFAAKAKVLIASTIGRGATGVEVAGALGVDIMINAGPGEVVPLSVEV